MASPKKLPTPSNDDGVPLLDAEQEPWGRGSAAIMEDRTPEILFHEDAIGDTDSNNDDDDGASRDGATALDNDASVIMYQSMGKVGSKQKWGFEHLAIDLQMLSVGIDMANNTIVKVEGYYLPEEQKAAKVAQMFVLLLNECIVKVHLFRVRREIHAIQFVTNLRTSERFGVIKHGELCKAVEAPKGKYITSFFGDMTTDEDEMNLCVRFAEWTIEAEAFEEEVDVAEVDQVRELR
ncbi:hypothetical protein CCR75_001573 [Bremia lactucae]|uniref:Uncharacterized protein n=1 Tax=Bremia lactucae TaxID=4779 RepID=A0A976NY12_BRELC|nr:hypothetical protein CCR75_001573 [Bremia lactucae]